jgi:acetyl-CoA carboxylase biotin carboxylase subunit
MGRAAVDIAKRAGYVGAGTCEFMVDQDLSFYFLEVNTRLQVEHPVTEMVTGIDLVKEQIAIAEGEKLRYTQDDIKLSGHAIECRIYAEDPEQGFAPSTGTLKHFRIPAGPGVRVDAGVVIFADIPIYYDPMIAKMIVWGHDRTEAIARTKRALEEFRVFGLKTTIGFHRVVMDNAKFVAGDLSTRFLEEEYPDNKYAVIDADMKEHAAIAVALDTFIKERHIAVALPGDGAATTSPCALSPWVAFHRRSGLRSFQGDGS